MDCFATQTSIETVFKEKGEKNLHLLKVWLERSSPHHYVWLTVLSRMSKYQLRASFFHFHNFLSFSFFVYTSILMCAASLLLLLSWWPYQKDVSSCNLHLIINSVLWICSSVNGHRSSNAHFLSDTFPSECYFFPSHCTVINPSGQYTEITSKPCT